jgi:hypothetical protein
MGIRGLWVAVTAGLCILVPSRQIAEPAWLKLDGHDWKRLSPEAKQAYLAGFLAGAATAEAANAGTADTAGLRHALDSLSRIGFRFPYSPTVYGARVDDFYWYENQRILPLWYVLWEVNTRLRDPAVPRQ